MHYSKMSKTFFCQKYQYFATFILIVKDQLALCTAQLAASMIAFVRLALITVDISVVTHCIVGYIT